MSVSIAPDNLLIISLIGFVPTVFLPCTKHPEPHGDVGISGTNVARNGF